MVFSGWLRDYVDTCSNNAVITDEIRNLAAGPLFTVMLTVYFGAPSMFITLWFGFDYGTNPPLGTLII
jgi:hypothetical protein